MLVEACMRESQRVADRIQGTKGRFEPIGFQLEPSSDRNESLSQLFIRPTNHETELDLGLVGLLGARAASNGPRVGFGAIFLFRLASGRSFLEGACAPIETRENILMEGAQTGSESSGVGFQGGILELHFARRNDPPAEKNLGPNGVTAELRLHMKVSTQQIDTLVETADDQILIGTVGRFETPGRTRAGAITDHLQAHGLHLPLSLSSNMWFDSCRGMLPP
ncbi:MAG: hypothetical protein AAF657_15345 [Acidobacteriota bacterium]